MLWAYGIVFQLARKIASILKLPPPQKKTGNTEIMADKFINDEIPLGSINVWDASCVKSLGQIK